MERVVVDYGGQEDYNPSPPPATVPKQSPTEPVGSELVEVAAVESVDKDDCADDENRRIEKSDSPSKRDSHSSPRSQSPKSADTAVVVAVDGEATRRLPSEERIPKSPSNPPSQSPLPTVTKKKELEDGEFRHSGDEKEGSPPQRARSGSRHRAKSVERERSRRRSKSSSRSWSRRRRRREGRRQRRRHSRSNSKSCSRSSLPRRTRGGDSGDAKMRSVDNGSHRREAATGVGTADARRQERSGGRRMDERPPARRCGGVGEVAYFVMRSNNEENIRTSMERGVWATQGMNEPVLNDYFERSKRVILFFSVCRSAHFQGYATMTSNIGRKRTQGLWNNCSNDGRHMQSRGRRRPKWGNDFSVRWDKICDVPFDRTNFIRNTLNEGKPVKYSRDGQRLTTDAGVQLTALIDRITAKEGMGSAIIRKPVAIHSGEVAFQKVFVDGRLEIASSTPMASAIAAATAAAAAAGSKVQLMDAAAASGGEMAQRLLLAQMTNPFAVISTGNGPAVNTGLPLLGAAATGVRAAHGEAAANGRRKSRSSSHTRSTSWRRRRQRRVGGGRNRYGNGGDERRRRGSDGRRGERSRDGDRDRRRDRGRDRDKRRRRSESHSRSRSRRRRGQRY